MNDVQQLVKNKGGSVTKEKKKMFYTLLMWLSFENLSMTLCILKYC